MTEKYKSIKILALETIKLMLIGISMVSLAIYLLLNVFLWLRDLLSLSAACLNIEDWERSLKINYFLNWDYISLL